MTKQRHSGLDQTKAQSTAVARLPVGPYVTGPATLVTARSFLIDRARPDCEIVALPAKEVSGGVLAWRSVVRLHGRVEKKGILGRLRAAKEGTAVPLDGSIGIDFRVRTPENWAHFLNIHVPILFAICRHLDHVSADMTLVLPSTIPRYILAAASHLGLRVQCCDGPIEGPSLVLQMEDWGAIRSERATWIRQSGILERLVSGVTTGAALPRRVYLARRSSRNLANEAEVEAFLTRFGFVKIFPEDLSVADQFRLFNEVETLVAVHGAGLAPLLYRRADARLRQIVELLPCGHMTDVYRVMAEQVGCAWIGVRGRIQPEHIRPAYDFSKSFKQFSLDSFEVDPASLEMAFALAAHPIKETAVG